MKYKAYAKINLYLEITGIKENGYHFLETIFQEIDLFDELEFQIFDKNKDEILINSYGNYFVPNNEDNIIYKTIKLIKNNFGIKEGIRVNLNKNIPLGAGLGGGSSDASACIKFFQDYFGIKIDNDLASSLGADIPFFLNGKRCFATGIGENIFPIKNYKKKYIILVYPNININTGLIYKKFDEKYKNKPFIFKKSLTDTIKKSNLSEVDFEMFNRLEEIVFPLFPGIKNIKLLFDSFNIKSIMSGSGSSVFGVVDDFETAEKIKNYFLINFKNKYSVWVLCEI